MDKNYNIDDIENFLNQEMNAEELAAFEKELATDEGLANEVTFHEDVLKGIQNAAPLDFKKMVSGVHAEMKQEGFFSEETTEETTEKVVQKEAKVRSLSMFRKLAIAASFALVLAAGWWALSNQTATPDQLFADNFKVHQDVLSVEIEDRLAETGFGNNKKLLISLQSGINAYKTGDYTAAITQLKAFQNAAPEDPLTTYAQFYESVALLKTGEVATAEGHLLPLTQNANFPLQNDAKWYLSLAFLQQGKTNAAKAILQEIQDVERYRGPVNKMLKSL